jgi:hypothetical protein
MKILLTILIVAGLFGGGYFIIKLLNKFFIYLCAEIKKHNKLYKLLSKVANIIFAIGISIVLLFIILGLGAVIISIFVYIYSLL